MIFWEYLIIFLFNQTKSMNKFFSPKYNPNMNKFFPQNIIQTPFQSINCQYDHKNKNHSKGKYFSQKKKIVKENNFYIFYCHP